LEVSAPTDQYPSITVDQPGLQSVQSRSIGQSCRDSVRDHLNHLVDSLARDVQLSCYLTLRKAISHQIPNMHLTASQICAMQASQVLHRRGRYARKQSVLPVHLVEWYKCFTAKRSAGLTARISPDFMRSLILGTSTSMLDSQALDKLLPENY